MQHDQTNLAEDLKIILINKFNGKPASGGKEVVMYCRYCDDAHKHDHGHMYVGLPIGDSPPLFNCFYCGSKGIVTHGTLLEWGITDTELFIRIAKNNKRVLSLEKNMKYRDRDVYILNNNHISNNALSQAKLNFINKRLGTKLSYNDLLANKIVLNLYDLLNSNNIKNYSRSEFILNQLDESFIGFISADNAFVNLRNLREGKVHHSIDQRYVNYNVFNKYDNTERYYISPVNVDISNPEPIKLHIGEGGFDMLSVKYNLRKEFDHNIYASILGSSYFAMIKYFLSKIGLLNLEIHIYRDKDINPRYFDELIDILYPYNIHLFIHNNRKEGLDLFGKPIKDFGVPIEYIEEEIIQLC